jgi:hypothetical protein
MTTFTTEDRIITEQNSSVTINVEPIPFAGLVTLTESVPKFKELTDEEIKALWKPFPDTKYYDSDILNFARAILRKAQEK